MANPSVDGRNEYRTFGQKWRRWWGALPRRVRTYGTDVIGWAAVLGVFIWESRNATLGFQQLWHPGLPLAALGGVGTSLAAIFLTRLMMESFRAGHFYKGCLNAALALGAACVVLLGVWSNLAADSIRRGAHQIEATGDRDAIIKQIRSLEGDLRALPETIDIGLEADRESLRKVENIGRQWDLPKLDNNPGGDCDADLKIYPRSLCNQAADLRSDISTAEKAIAKRAEIQARLDAEREKIVDQVDSEGVEHLQEMAALMGDETKWKFWGSIATLIASAILLFIAAFVNDTMMERRQRPAGA